VYHSRPTALFSNRLHGFKVLPSGKRSYFTTIDGASKKQRDKNSLKKKEHSKSSEQEFIMKIIQNSPMGLYTLLKVENSLEIPP
jgi:hypothetical protein